MWIPGYLLKVPETQELVEYILQVVFRESLRILINGQITHKLMGDGAWFIYRYDARPLASTAFELNNAHASAAKNTAILSLYR